MVWHTYEGMRARRRHSPLSQAHLKDGDLLEDGEVDVEGELGLELVGQEAEGGVDVAAALDAAPRPAVVVPAEDAPLHAPGHLVVAHVRLGAVQQALELQPVGVAVGDDVADLADDRREDEDADEVADDREHVSRGGRDTEKKRERGKVSRASVSRAPSPPWRREVWVFRFFFASRWTSGPRRSLPPPGFFLSVT